MSIVEGSRLEQDYWHVWTLPKGMMREEAYRYFIEKQKPSGYRFERFHYNPRTGVMATI